MKYIAYILLFLYPHLAKAQYFNVSHTSGTLTIGGIGVTVTANNTISTYNTIWCTLPVGSYYAGNTSNTTGYKYEFSSPVSAVRLLIGGQNAGETFTFYVNGSAYPLTTANISSFTGGCIFTGSLVAVSGNLGVNSGYANGQIDIIAPRIDSFKVYHNGSYTLAGTVYNFYFSNDTSLNVGQYTDTLLCVGDTMNIPYNTGAVPFLLGNVFNFQLSDPTGSFSSFTTLGTVTGTSGGVFKYVIPNTITPSSNYRIRVTATTPSRISLDNGKDISIGVLKPLKPVALSNSLICSGNDINLSASTSTTGVTYRWTGPNNYISNIQNPVITTAQVVHSGQYIVSAKLFGCQSKDTVSTTVVQSPYPLTSNNDTTICTGKQLQLNANSPQTGVSFTWTGPNSFSSSSSACTLANIQLTNSGNYVVTATLNSCTVTDTVLVNVNTTPSKPVATVNNPVCSGGTAVFTATTSTTGTTWQWTGPNSFSSTLQNPFINNTPANAAGQYIVTSTLLGCSSSDTTTLSVNGTTANISISSNSPVCESDTIKLSSNATNATGYSWTGPNGFSATTKDTYIVHASVINTGSYYFAATYPGCVYYDTIAVSVTPHATGRAFSSNSPLCFGDTLRLSASTTSSNVAYTWTGPNSYVATTQYPNINNINNTQAGKYYVNFLLNGCIAKDSINVTINPPPIAITASANTPLCQGDTLRLNSTNSSTGVTWQWTGPGSYNATAKDTLLSNAQISASGDYIVTATNSYNCKAKDTVSVLVKPLPANLSATVNTPVCAGTTLLLSASTTSSGAIFSWVGPNSYSSSIQNPNFPAATTSATGNYIVTATINGCSVKDTVSAIVNALPATPAATANTPVCIGQDLMLNASTIHGATYQWTNAASFSSLLQNPVITNAKTTDAGKYYVRSVMNNCYSPFDSVTVNVIPAPSISVYPSPKDSICQGATVNFVSSNTNAGSTFIRTWYKNNNIIGGAANANYSTASAADNDEYFVTLTVSGICATPYTDTSNKITMKVLPWLAPSVSITANPNTTVISGTMINFTATPVNGGIKPTYQWTRNGANITGAISNVWGASTLSNNDQICVDMTSNYMCPNPKNTKSNCIKVSIESTGIARTWTEKVPKIYPNPVNDLIIIDGLEKETSIQLNDVTGRNVYNQLCKTAITQINTSNLVPGSYVLLLKTADGNSMTVKIIKE